MVMLVKLRVGDNEAARSLVKEREDNKVVKGERSEKDI
jgi:hypothetical protein